MPMTMLRLTPGINVEVTPSLLQAGYAQSNFGRFRAGLFEKLGGWLKYYQFAIGGIPRALQAWQDLNAVDYLGVGTTTTLGAISDNLFLDLTPQTFASSFAPDFDTTNTQTSVIVNDPNVDGITTLDSVEFLTPISVGGIILSGTYPVTLGLSTTTYQITALNAATATVLNGGVVPQFTTSEGSTSVTVTFPNHGLAVGNDIALLLATTVGGVTIQGTYKAVTVSPPNVFTIAVNTQATSNATAFMNGGNVSLLYYIALGPLPTASGYSIGPYSTGGYSTGVAPSQQSGSPITAPDWTLDNWGDTLLACPSGGGVYSWEPNSGLQNAQLVGNASVHNAGLFVSMQTQMLILYGASVENTIGASQNPLLVAWSDVGDYTSFIPSVTSQAGSRLLPTGSKIVGGMSCPLQELLWTDLDVWSMSYLGSLAAGVWGFTKIGGNCGLIGRHAAVVQGSNIYWMGVSNFFLIGIGGGAPQAIPCSVWDDVFQNLNTAYQSKCFAWSNTPFNEVFFFFPRASTNATECDAYVKLNTLTGLWDNVQDAFDRTCGIDQSVVGMPISASSKGIVYQHEVSPDADGQPLYSWFQTGLYQLSEGQDVMLIDWWLPDFKWNQIDSSTSASLNITIYSQYYLSDTPEVHGPYTVTAQTPYFNPRVRGRFLSYKVESNQIGAWFRFGGSRIRMATDGRLP